VSIGTLIADALSRAAAPVAVLAQIRRAEARARGCSDIRHGHDVTKSSAGAVLAPGGSVRLRVRPRGSPCTRAVAVDPAAGHGDPGNRLRARSDLEGGGLACDSDDCVPSNRQRAVGGRALCMALRGLSRASALRIHVSVSDIANLAVAHAVPRRHRWRGPCGPMVIGRSGIEMARKNASACASAGRAGVCSPAISIAE